MSPKANENVESLTNENVESLTQITMSSFTEFQKRLLICFFRFFKDDLMGKRIFPNVLGVNTKMDLETHPRSFGLVITF